MGHGLKISLLTLFHPQALLLMVKSVVGAAILLFCLGALGIYLLHITQFFTGTSLEHFSFLEGLAEGSGIILMLIAGYLLFPIFIVVIGSLFSDSWAATLETHLLPPEVLGLPRQSAKIRDHIKIGLRLILESLGGLILILLCSFIPLVNILVYTLMTARLLRKELYMTLALRFLPLPEAEATYQIDKKKIFLVACGISLLFLIPILNLFGAIWGLSLMAQSIYGKNNTALRQRLALAPSEVLSRG